MKQFYILSFLFLVLAPFLTEQSLAVTAYPHPVQITQRDGTVITVIMQGDERVKWAKTTDGYALIYNSQGVYEYAKQDASGDMVPSGVKARDISDRTLPDMAFLARVQKNMTFSPSQVSVMKQVMKSMKSGGPERVFPTTGSRKLICILIGFTDKAFTKTQTDFQNLFNQVNYTVDGATGSVKDFFTESSYNQLSLTVDVAGPFAADNPMAYYGANDSNGNDLRPRELVTEAVQKADATVNYADYDNDGDGSVDGVYVIFAGYGEEAGAGADEIWSHAWAITPVTCDGKTISRYSCSPELRGNSGTGLTRIGVICHEFGHLLGAPDFYDTNYAIGGSFLGTGNWDLQAGGSWNGDQGATPAQSNPYTKIYVYNWATANTLTSQSTITLLDAARNSNSFYRINTTTEGEYFLLENRQKVGFDANIPGHGLLVYHVHKDIVNYYGTNTINATYPQMMYPVCASAATEPGLTPSSYGNINSGGCPFPGTSGKDEFTDASTPSQKSWAGAYTNKPITNITEDNTAKTITLCFIGCSNDPANFAGTPVSKSQINLIWTKNSSDNPVLVAFSTTPIFGTPVSGSVYNAGDAISGGGTVIYKGTLTTFNHLGLVANTNYYYRAWSVLSGNDYSSGIVAIVKTLPDPDDPTSFAATPAGNTQINLNWVKNGLNNDVMLAFSTSPNFGTPVNGTVYSAGGTFSGGGTVIYTGALTTFNHTGLTAGTTYYYKAWSVLSGNAYSSGIVTQALTGGINAGDYLALLALYNQCNGPNWTRKANWLTGPVESWEGVIVENNRVVQLNLGDWNTSVGLIGPIPAELSNLTEIKEIDLLNNQLSGNLPESWSALTNLQYINLDANKLTGTLPESWSALVNLQLISVQGNQLSGSLPESWSNLKSLNGISLYTNQLTGTLPPSWSALSKLEYITLGYNQLSGSLPESWSAMVNLAIVNLQNNQFSGTLPESWSALVKMRYLWLQRNELTGTFPLSWLNMTGLMGLSLDDNHLTGTLPESMTLLTQLQWLGLLRNQFTGTLADSWSSMINLQRLNLGGNQFTGTLPESWSLLVNLKILDLGVNNLTGPLPDSWSSLTNLQELILYYNEFTGILPDSWTKFVNLERLYLSSNQISGLPDFSGLTGLNHLLIERNMLDFGDIEPNIGVPKSTFSYAPQAPVGTACTLKKNMGEEVRLTVKVEGQNNRYQWYKNGGVISGATSSYYVIPAVITSDAGNYTCKITNTVATDLTLTSQPVTLQVDDPLNWSVDPFSFNFSGQIFGQVFIDDIAVTGGNGILAAFLGNQCRGVKQGGFLTQGGKYVFLLPLYSNATMGETFIFKYFDPIRNRVFDIQWTIPWSPGITVGSFSNPTALKAYSSSQISKRLAAGWTWFSLNVSNTDMSTASVLSNLISSDGDYIKNQTISATYYDGTGWFGDLTQINPKEMYKIKLSKADTLKFSGSAVDPLANLITIKTGWNWIGYIPQSANTVTQSLSTMVPVADDYIKNQTKSSTFYDGVGWFGELINLEPLDGYMLKSGHAGTLTYPVYGTPLLTASDQRKSVGTHICVLDGRQKTEDNKTFRPEAFEYSGQITATVFLNGRNFESEDYCLYSLVDGQVRGVSRGLWFEPGKEWIHNHITYSNASEGDTIRFRLHDSGSDNWYEFEEFVVFSADMLVNNALNPFILKNSTLLVPRALSLEPSLDIWPNPVSYLATIRYIITRDQSIVIQVIDFSGRLIDELEFGKQQVGEHMVTWDTRMMEQGVYYLRIKNVQSVYKQIVITR